jgi:hypothetical protein
VESVPFDRWVELDVADVERGTTTLWGQQKVFEHYFLFYFQRWGLSEPYGRQ